jgi:hypothetical protein
MRICDRCDATVALANSRSKDGHDLGASDCVKAKVEAHDRGARVSVDVETLHVNGVNRVHVAVRHLARWGCRAHEAEASRVVA